MITFNLDEGGTVTLHAASIIRVVSSNGGSVTIVELSGSEDEPDINEYFVTNSYRNVMDALSKNDIKVVDCA